MKPIRLHLVLGLAAAAQLGFASERPAAGALGLELARAGRCEAALPELDAALALDPDDADLWRLSGACRLRLRQYEEAVADLEQARALAPSAAGIDLDLAKALYHADRHDRAAEALERAEARDPDRAEVALYRGMLQLEADDDEAAIVSFERARSLDAARVDPVASYYLGLALARTGDREAAEYLLEGVARDWPETSWAREAEASLASLRRGALRRAWITLGTGIEYDSNVVLLGRDLTLPTDISDQADGRAVWLASGGLDLWRGERTVLTTLFGYRGRTQFELDEFDSHFPTASVVLDRELRETTSLRLRYDFGYAWVDSAPFFSTSNLQLSAFQSWERAGTTEIFGGAYRDEYFQRSNDVIGPDAPPGPGNPLGGCVPNQICGPPGLDERSERNRDGYGWLAGIGQVVPLASGAIGLDDPAIRAGYRFTSYEANGREYTYEGHRLWAALEAGLPLELLASVTGSYAYQPYRHPSTFPNPSSPPPIVLGGPPYLLSGTPRRDNVWTVGASLTRAFADRFSAQLAWRYTDNQSNTEVFDYQQHVVGLTVNVTFARLP